MLAGKVTSRRLAFGVPPDLEAPGGEAVAWFTNPPGGVVQMTAPGPGTAELGQWIVGAARDRLFARFPDVNDFSLVIDVSLLTTRDGAFRSLLTDAARELQPRCARFALVPPPGSAIYMKSLEVSVLLLRGFGVNVDIHKSTASAIAAYGLMPASKSFTPRSLSEPLSRPRP